MAAIDATKHLFKYTRGATRGARRDTLEADGPLLVAAGHFIAVVLQRTPASGSADVAVTNRELEFVFGEVFVATDELLDKNLLWAIAVDTRCSQLLADADAAGLLDWTMRPEDIESLQEQLVPKLRGLPAGLLALEVGDVDVTLAPQQPDDWFALL